MLPYMSLRRVAKTLLVSRRERTHTLEHHVSNRRVDVYILAAFGVAQLVVLLVQSFMTENLTRNTRGTPKRDATILTTSVTWRYLVALSNVHANKAQQHRTYYCPKEYEEVALDEIIFACFPKSKTATDLHLE